MLAVFHEVVYHAPDEIDGGCESYPAVSVGEATYLGVDADDFSGAV